MTVAHADVFYFNQAKKIKFSHNLDDEIDAYTLWIALSNIDDEKISRLVFAKGSHRIKGFTRSLSNLV